MRKVSNGSESALHMVYGLVYDGNHAMVLVQERKHRWVWQETCVEKNRAAAVQFELYFATLKTAIDGALDHGYVVKEFENEGDFTRWAEMVTLRRRLKCGDVSLPSAQKRESTNSPARSFFFFPQVPRHEKVIVN